MGLRQTASKWYRAAQAWLSAPDVTVFGARSDTEATPPSFDYVQPLLLPGYAQRALKSSEAVQAYLQESALSAYQFQFDSPYNKGNTPFIPPSEDPLREWDSATREYVLSQTHAAYQRHPIANAAVEYTADFVVGDGANITYKAKEVEDYLQDFIDNPDNAMREYERQAVVDLQVDGELILRYFKGKPTEGTGGQLVVLPMRPWELQWIETELGNYRRPVTYRFQRYQTRGDSPAGGTETKFEDVPAEDVLHVKINAHGYELRGRPDLYKILPWLRGHSEFLQNRARQNYWRGALLWLVKVMNGNAAQVASVAARWSRPPTPGSVSVESGNVEVEAAVNSANGGEASEDGRQIKLQSIIGMRMAEYMFADGQNANLASATAQQLPAITRFNAYQNIMRERFWYPMLKKALQQGIDDGVLQEEYEEVDSTGKVIKEEPRDDMPANEDTATEAEMPMTPIDVTKLHPALANPKVLEDKGTPKKIKTLDAFDVSYAQIQDADLKTLADAMGLAEEHEWASKQTAQERMGFDPAMERERIEREQKADLKAIAQGRKPVPPEMIPQQPPPDKQPFGGK